MIAHFLISQEAEVLANSGWLSVNHNTSIAKILYWLIDTDIMASRFPSIHLSMSSHVDENFLTRNEHTSKHGKSLRKEGK